MKIAVYHSDRELEIHVHVANVTVPDSITDVWAALEYAWRWTNNVDGSWSMKLEGDANPNVEVVAPLPVHNGKTWGLRSSMSYDLFVVDNTYTFRVASIGFVAVNMAAKEKYGFD